MTDTRNAEIRVLLVEDNPIDARATIRAAQRLNIANEIDHVTDGAEAIAHLNRLNGHERPDLVLLDLNLPGADGHDVLEAMRADPELRRIPVVILTTSESDSDIARSYDLGANAFITKPVGIEGWLEVVNTIDDFWFSLVKLPPR